MKKFLRYFVIILVIAALISDLRDFLFPSPAPAPQPVQQTSAIAEDQKYYSRDDVALYIHTYNKLPANYVTKNQARKMGWQSDYGRLWDVCEGCIIGGDNFANREGKLPQKKGRVYYECDVNFNGKKRKEERIVYSNDGLIYYTEDHYNTFILLYGDE